MSNPAFAFPVSTSAEHIADSLYNTKNGGMTSQSLKSSTKLEDSFQNVVNATALASHLCYNRVLKQWKRNFREGIREK